MMGQLHDAQARGLREFRLVEEWHDEPERLDRTDRVCPLDQLGLVLFPLAEAHGPLDELELLGIVEFVVGQR